MNYRYRFLSRPADSFSCPRENFVAFHTDDKYRRFGIVEYSQPLTIEQATHFDLCPLFLDDYNGRQVNFFENYVGTIELKHNDRSGQLFFAVTYDDDTTTIVWHEFIKHVESGRYKMIQPQQERKEQTPEQRAVKVIEILRADYNTNALAFEFNCATYLAGDYNKRLRQAIVKHVTGENLPVVKCGLHKVSEILKAKFEQITMF